MHNENIPSRSDLPTSVQLARSTAIAIVAAVAILVTVVLPAEYGIDPTGIGSKVGLTDMGLIKVRAAQVAESDSQPVVDAQAAVNSTPVVVDDGADDRYLADAPAVENSTPIAVDDGAEDKKTADAQTVEEQNETTASTSAQSTPSDEAEEWRDEISITLAPGEATEVKLVMRGGARASFEWTANGGVLNYDKHGDNNSGEFISYEQGRSAPSGDGTLEAAFDGSHGWFWINPTNVSVTVTFRASGDYLEMKRLL